MTSDLVSDRGIAAWPVDTFVEANDFTGETVIPFATFSSSGMGELTGSVIVRNRICRNVGRVSWHPAFLSAI